MAATMPGASERATINRLERLLEISVELNSISDVNALLQIIMDAATELTGTDTSSVMLIDPSTRDLFFAATSQSSSPELIGMTVPMEGSIAGAVVKSKQPLIVPDVIQDPRHDEQVGKTVGYRVRSILAVPMMAERRIVGVLEILNKTAGTFTKEDVQTLAHLASVAAIAIHKAGLIVQLQNANEKLSELDRLKSDFIAIASHELRTPLLVILGYANLLQDRVGGQELDRVLAAAGQLRDLMQDMFNLQYVDTGNAKLDHSFFCLSQLAAHVVQERQNLAQARGQKICLALSDKQCCVWADRESLRLVLTNIISNALKFTPPGGRIDVNVIRRAGEAWVEVTDTGIGIPAHEQKRIFDRFYQVEPHLCRKYGGLGIGLSVAKALLTLQQGRIWVKSKENKGSTFTFALPLSREKPQPSGRPRT